METHYFIKINFSGKSCVNYFLSHVEERDVSKMKIKGKDFRVMIFTLLKVYSLRKTALRYAYYGALERITERNMWPCFSPCAFESNSTPKNSGRREAWANKSLRFFSPRRALLAQSQLKNENQLMPSGTLLFV